MKYFEITNNKNVKTSDILLAILGYILSVCPIDIPNNINLNENTTILRNDKSEYISEVDKTLAYYDLVEEKLYSCIGNAVKEMSSNITIDDDKEVSSEIIDFDSELFVILESVHLYNSMRESKRSVSYLRVVDSTNILCIDINNDGIIVINFNANKKFNFDIFPSIKTNRIIYYIDIDNYAVKAEPELYSRNILSIIGLLFNSVCEQFSAACIYNGYYRVAPLFIFGEYLYEMLGLWSESSCGYSIADGIMHKYAYSNFNIPNFLEFYINESGAEREHLSLKPCNIIKFLSEQEKIIHEYPVKIYSVMYHDEDALKALINNLDKALIWVIITPDDINEDGVSTITTSLNYSNICAIFIIYHDEECSEGMKEFINSISYDHINLGISENNIVLGMNGTKTYNIALDEYAPYNLLSLVPEIKSKFDADHKNGIPKSIDEYKEHPMGNPSPMIVDKPVENAFAHKK